MARGLIRAAVESRVNPLVPVVVALAGLAGVLLGYRWIGLGVAVGAGLAYINGLFLSRRVELAAGSMNVAGALLVMQVGLMVTFVIIGVAEVILVKISITMAVASAAGFAVAQLAILATFYWTRARSQPTLESGAS